LDNIAALWARTKKQHSLRAETLKAQILTMASPRDVCGMRWEDIDLPNRVWTRPQKGVSVPLSMPMMEMLTKTQHLSGVSPFVFFIEPTGRPPASVALCRHAGAILGAFKDWASTQNFNANHDTHAILEAWATYVTGGANV
jgi:hypothetical protein